MTKFMRILLFFDLPTETSKNRRNYRKFRKNLISLGFLMEQESVYSKLALNPSQVETILNKVRDIACDGTIQTLIITERQYQNIKYISGFKDSKVVDSTEKVLII